jgi:hypothetical protein
MMSRKQCMSLILGGTLAFSAGAARAQQETPTPPPPGPMIHGGPGGEFMAPMGERIELLGFEGMHGGKTVTGAPFSAVAVSVSTQTLADGNQISHKTQTNLFRDSQGRFRKEVTLPAIGPLATAGQPKSFVFINDPVASANFVLHPDTKIAEQMGQRHGGMKGSMKSEMKDKAGAWEAKAAASGNFKKEDLGTQTIAGVSAQGTRYTRTIPVGQIGNEKAIVVVSEHWYSADLQMVVKSTRNDPRFGETTYTVTSIQRTEPAASLFTVPADYTVQQGGMGRHGLHLKQPPAAPASPPSDN